MGAAGEALREHVVLEGLPIVLVADPAGAPEAIAYVHADHLGTPSKMTDAAGQIVWDAVFGPSARPRASQSRPARAAPPILRKPEIPDRS